MSVMGDMQALVMELKNLVEQCLASERAVQVLRPYPSPTCTREDAADDQRISC